MDAKPIQPPSVITSCQAVPNRPARGVFVFSLAVPLVAEFAVLMATGKLGSFLWLFQQAAPLLLVAWPVTLPLAIWASYSYTKLHETNALNSRRLLWLMPLVVLPTAMLVWGAFFAHHRGQGFVRWQLTVIHGTFWLNIAIGVAAIIFNRGRRSFVVPLTLMMLLFSFSCAFTAGSSVTGDWL